MRDSAARPRSRLLPSGVEGRLYLLIALALALSLGLLGWSYWQRYQAERDNILRSELEVAKGVEETFTAFVRDVHRTSTTLGFALPRLKPGENVNKLLAQAAQQYASVSEINWTSPQGHIVASSAPPAIGADLSDRDYFQKVAKGSQLEVSELLKTGRVSKQPTFVVATGIHNSSGEFLGAIVVAVDPTRLGSLTLTQVRPEGSSYVLFDSNGVLVFRRPNLETSWEERGRWLEHDDLLVQAQRGQEAVGETYSISSGVRLFAARVPMEFGWVAGAGRTVDSALTPIRKAIAFDMALSTLLILAMLVFALFIGRSISLPLRRLEQDVLAFGQGESERRANVSGPVEVAEVASVFNRMASDLSAYQTSLENQVKERTTELEASNRELEAFSYTVAHDLRSPLRALDGFSRHLLRHHAERLDDSGKGYLNRITRAAQRMGNLIDDLLNMANVARRPLQLEAVDVGELVAPILRALHRSDPGREADIDISPSLSICADRHMIFLALEQLLDNAWRHTEKREIAQISVGMVHINDKKAYFVRDNGDGFDMKYANKLFLPFHRLDPSDDHAGTGMGLALVQRIVARHGGRIWVESAPDKGATFYFTLGENV